MDNFIQEYQILKVADREKGWVETETGEKGTFSGKALSLVRDTTYDAVELSTRTKINEKLRNAKGVLVKIKFRKKIEAKKLMELINGPIQAKTQKEAEELVKGDERELVGICLGEDDNGNHMFQELVEKEVGFSTQVRYVSPSTISELTINKTKYVA